MPKGSRADRAQSTVLRPFAKVEPSEAVTARKAEYFEWVNVVGVLLQVFAVSRILARPVVVAALGREHRRRSGVLEQRAAQGLEGMGMAIP